MLNNFFKTIESEMLLDIAQNGLRIKEVEVGVRYDVGQPARHPIHHSVRVLMKCYTIWREKAPLLLRDSWIAIPVGVTMGMESLHAFSQGQALEFLSMLMMIFITLVGMFMAFTGIILHSMSKLLHEFKKASITPYR